MEFERKKFMMEIYYSENKKVIITDLEFSKAAKVWREGKSCWCERIKTLLSPYFKVAEPINLNYFYFEGRKGIVDGNEFKIFDKDGGVEEFLPLKEVKDKIISPDEYFDKSRTEQIKIN